MTGRMPTLMLRSLPRTSMRNARVNVQVRNVATRATPEASGSSSTRWNLAGAAAGLVGAGAAAYAIQSQGKPLQLEGRKLWSDRMKPRESKGDASLHQDAQLRHVEPDAEPVADETPGTIEVAVEEVEGEAGQQQSAYNPDTGEINWDCPCLGGMADGPCGEQFKAAFSCFIYSEAEPKGIDCVDKFKTMQNCFREHPEIYKEEIEDDEAANESFEAEEQAVSAQNIEQ